jgi:hypothetical protein
MFRKQNTKTYVMQTLKCLIESIIYSPAVIPDLRLIFLIAPKLPEADK